METVSQELPAALEVRLDEPLTARLLDRVAGPDPGPAVSVGALVNPRVAYFREVSPVRETGERADRMEIGRGWHRRLSALLGGGGAQEVRIHREGLTGQIDLMTDRITEIKTTRELPDRTELAAARPEYLEQLGVYCTLVGDARGRLILLSVREGTATGAEALEVDFRGLETTRLRGAERAALLRQALRHSSVDGLPRCTWFGRGCEYQTAGVCPCRGDEPIAEPLVDFSSLELRSDGPATERLRREVVGTAIGPSPRGYRFRDLLYPRRGALDVLRGSPDQPSGEPRRPRIERDLYRAVTDAIDSEPVPASTRRPARDVRLLEDVASLHGSPFLVKIRRDRRALPVEALRRAQPQYFVELGLRCAAVGATTGWLFLGHELSERREDWLRALHVDFGDPNPFALDLLRRLDELDAAVASGTPERLPECPEWRWADCPHRAGGSCGPTPTTAGG